VETVLILVLAAGLSAALVWWALAPTGDRRRVPRRARLRRVGAELPPASTDTDSFVLLPVGGPILPEDRPPRARSVLVLAAAIMLVAAVSVVVLTLLGLVLKAQLDRYFTGAG
jgi:hypothetical protein